MRSYSPGQIGPNFGLFRRTGMRPAVILAIPVWLSKKPRYDIYMDADTPGLHALTLRFAFGRSWRSIDRPGFCNVMAFWIWIRHA